MQSGIAASEELHNAFKAFLSTPSQRGLFVTISSSPEALVPTQTVASTSASFSEDLVNLEPHISDNAASYVILKRDDAGPEGSGSCVAVTYVPDKAPVRQKMLFASTRLTLVRELGTEHFSQTLFATLASELTASGWAKHEAHNSLSAPLTEEEQSLVGIREAEAQESMGTGARSGGHVAKGVSLPADNPAQEALKQLGKGELGLVQLEIDIPNERLVLASTHHAPLAPSQVGGTISASTPRYSFYSLAPSVEASSNGPPKVLFVYTNPPSTTINIKARMLYASSRNSTEHIVAPNNGITLAGKLEGGDPADITEADILAALGVDGGQGNGASGGAGVNTAGAGTLGRGGGFARPKRPGKR